MTNAVTATVAARLLRILAATAAAIVTARELGPEGRGTYVFVVTAALLVTQLGSLGLPSSNTYLVAKERDLLAPLTANSLLVALAVGGAGGLAVAGSLAAAGASGAIWLAAALAPPTLFFLLGTNLLVGAGRITAFNVVETAANLTVLLLLVGVALLTGRVEWFLAATVAGWTAAALALGSILPRARLRFDAALFRRGLSYAMRAYVLTLLGFLVLRANVFLLERLSSDRELGYFSIAAQIADVLIVLPTSVALVLFPRLVREEHSGFGQTLRVAGIVGGLLVLLCAAAAALAPWAIELAFTSSFSPSVEVLWWLLPGVVALGVATVLSQYLAALRFPRAVFGVWASALAVALVLGVPLTERHDAIGAAAATTAAHVWLLAGMVVVTFRHRVAR